MFGTCKDAFRVRWLRSQASLWNREPREPRENGSPRGKSRIPARGEQALQGHFSFRVVRVLGGLNGGNHFMLRGSGPFS